LKEPVAVELFSAGYCNMACKYCYIPKNKELKKVNEKIIEKMKNGKFVENMKEYYGDNLEIISLWGTEPTINLDIFAEYMLDDIIEEFPKFNKISFSSNMLDYTDDIIKLAEKLEQNNRDITLNVQFSDDGLNFTDKNRYQGASNKVRDNIKYLLTSLDELDLESLKFSSHFKATTSIDNMEEMLEDNSISDWFKYFEDIYFTWFDDKISNKDRIKFSSRATPTLVCPGEYTMRDAKVWTEFTAKLFEISKNNDFKYIKGSLNNYTGRLSKLVKYYGELGNKPWMFTCSAGDSQMGLNTDGTFGMCHRMFYTVEDEYLKECNESGVVDYEQELFMEKDFTSKVSNRNRDRIRLETTQRLYHDFWAIKISNLDALIYEMIDAGQLKEVYLEDNVRRLFTLLLSTGLTCQADRLAITGSQFVSSADMVRLWGNGAFENTFKDYMYWRW